MMISPYGEILTLYEIALRGGCDPPYGIWLFLLKKQHIQTG